jgi:aspartyl-tRNA synthetase
MKRTHTCGQLQIANVGQEVVLQGWVNKIRKMGALTFVDLRDRYGITQLVLSDAVQNEDIKPEYVIEITGKVIERKSKNANIATGAIEIEVQHLTVINKADLTPFEIKDDITAQEDTRLKYRYLDLRRPVMQNNLITRSKVNNIMRNYFNDHDFIEIETPVFAKSTPEGARDFLVPSRLNENKFYALPQSPQLFKQLFMIAGLDRYFQIVKCFRDEDLRIDRQPEFTQLDLEMSFATQEDVIEMIEGLMAQILKKIKGIDLALPLQRIDYTKAIEMYGSDKPDLRFELVIQTLNEQFKQTEIPFFKTAIDNGDAVRGIFVPKVLTKKDLEALTETTKQNRVNILAFAKWSQNEWSGSIASKLNDAEKTALLKTFAVKAEGTFLFVADKYALASQAMGAIRNHAAKLADLIDEQQFKLLWVVKFPLFEWSEEEERFVAAHHPFTMPTSDCLASFDTDKASAFANAYDIVMNGFEIGGGSQRITDPEIQERMFQAVEMPQDVIERNFGWFIKAYNYGAPYHSGCALGIDRICMLLSHAENIREVIAFPKNSSGVDPMSNAPDFVDAKQLAELNIQHKK